MFDPVAPDATRPPQPADADSPWRSGWSARTIRSRLASWSIDSGTGTSVAGLVATPSDLGRNGALPTHPELLDFLAAEFNGRRLEAETGPQTHRAFGELSPILGEPWATRAAIDPGNELLWRQNLRRLEAEAIRDAVLATTGKLNLKMGERGIFPALPREVLETQSRPGDGWKTSPPEEQGRRSVYIFIKRTLGVPLLETFDFASPDKSSATRTTTTIAPQALTLLNSAFLEEQATAFAARVTQLSKGDHAQEIQLMYRLALQRTPTEKEQQIARSYLARANLAALGKLILNLNEFVYID